jgi:hypothetical protein
VPGSKAPFAPYAFYGISQLIEKKMTVIRHPHFVHIRVAQGEPYGYILQVFHNAVRLNAGVTGRSENIIWNDYHKILEINKKSRMKSF